MIDRKIINDPVHGMMAFKSGLIYTLINHPYFQRLRRITQMGLSHLVYPGAVHTRFQHALGATFLMSKSLDVLRSKDIEISDEEYDAACAAVLLHDIGHGPYSHALEYQLIPIHHEAITLEVMNMLNLELGGQLRLAIDIFKNNYHRNFFHQLVSSQLDVDRLDYLTRDSFFTGVVEGTIGYERIINMFNVTSDELVVEEKAIYTIERYLQSRKFMYQQVYLHKTSLGAEAILKSFIRRLTELLETKPNFIANFSNSISDFISSSESKNGVDDQNIKQYLSLDDNDVVFCLKVAQSCNDQVLRRLSTMLIERKLPKVKIQDEAFSNSDITLLKQEAKKSSNFTFDELNYFIFQGEETLNIYNIGEDEIEIVKKDGTKLNFSKYHPNVDSQNFYKKCYICNSFKF